MYDDIESRAKYAESIYVDLNKIIMSEESEYKNSLNRNLIEVGDYKSILKNLALENWTKTQKNT